VVRRSLTLLVATFALLLPAAEAMAVDYQMVVTLDATRHRLAGSQRVQWFNRSDVATDELWWHLYLNAFANEETTFLRELGGRRLRMGRRGDDMTWGWVTVTRMRLADGTDLLPSLEFMRPDDGNPEDYSVARVRLPEPVEPGGSVTVQVEFEAQLPSIIARTGFASDFHLVGQWFPKLGVFEGVDGWNCHQYHANSEYFAEFGSYRVTINVPAGWVVAASGVEITRMEVPNDPDRGLQVVYSADRVHDFAWTAAPGSLMEVVSSDFEPGRDVPAAWLERAMRTLGLSAAELELAPTRLRLLLPRSQAMLAERNLRAARLGLAWYGLWYGPYPYSQLTVVVPPPTAEEAGGMEYPTFITGFGSRLLSVAPFRWLSIPETVVIHELGHQYFYGMLASNEFEQAWLDEGLNSYEEMRCMDAVVADRLAPDLHWRGFWSRERIAQSTFRAPFTIDQYSWRFRSSSSYFAASYGKTALALRTLEGLIGADRFARAMRAYFDRFEFGHPTGNDLFAVLGEDAGEDLGWFLEQAFRSDAVVDWAVLRVRQNEQGTVEGVVWNGEGWDEPPISETPADGGGWSIEVDIGRQGDFVGPVEVELVFEDGSRERRSWDGVARWVRWTLDGSARLSRVIVDPDGVWVLETRRQDNYWAAEPSNRVACRSLWWVSEALQWLGLFHLPWS
jgi:hypothetical protein